MARYIDVERLKRTFASGIRVYDGMCKIADVMHNIENEPTADVVEVKHAEWIDRYKNKYSNRLYVCSACGCKALYDFYENDLNQTEARQELTDVCPHCLAKMDGGNKNDL